MYVWVSMIGNTHPVRNVKGKVEINQSIYARLQKNSSCPGSFGFQDFLTNLKLVLIFLLIESVDMIPLLRRFTVN